MPHRKHAKNTKLKKKILALKGLTNEVETEAKRHKTVIHMTWGHGQDIYHNFKEIRSSSPKEVKYTNKSFKTSGSEFGINKEIIRPMTQNLQV